MNPQKFGYSVSIDLQKQRVFLEPADSGQILTQKSQVEDALQAAGITFGIDDAAIQAAFDPESNEHHSVLIASAEPPSKGEPARIRFNIPISCDEYPEKAAHFEICRAGCVIAQILPPTQGKAGHTLSGEEIPGIWGNDKPVQIGPGIEKGETGELVSTYEGRPLYNGRQLSIEPLLVVQQDLDAHSPPINFDGHVVVLGAIHDGARISALSLDVRGPIESAEIQCEGAFFARREINAHGEGDIFINGDALFQDVNDAIVTVHGNVEAGNLNNCEFNCLGRVTARAIAGGRCSALLGIVVSELGSEQSKTILEPGIHYELRDLITQIQDVTERIGTALHPIEPFLEAPSSLNNLTQHSREALRNRGSHFLQLTHERAQLVKRRNQLLESANSAVANIVVNQERKGQLVIHTPNAQFTLSSKRQGAILITGDNEKIIESTHLTGPLMTPAALLSAIEASSARH